MIVSKRYDSEVEYKPRDIVFFPGEGFKVAREKITLGSLTSCVLCSFGSTTDASMCRGYRGKEAPGCGKGEVYWKDPIQFNTARKRYYQEYIIGFIQNKLYMISLSEGDRRCVECDRGRVCSKASMFCPIDSRKFIFKEVEHIWSDRIYIGLEENRGKRWSNESKRYKSEV